MPAYFAPEVEFRAPLAQGTTRSPSPALPAAPVRPQLSLADYPWALAFLGFLAGATAFLSLVLVGRLRIASWARNARAVLDPRVCRAFEWAREQTRKRGEFRLLESEHLETPITVGTLRPAVLLPKGFSEPLSEHELKAVALHELAHLRRRDPVVLGLVSLLRAVLFFHPLVWVACRQVSNLAEAACDEVVLDVTGEPVTYAKMLARLAERLSARSFPTELAAGIVLSKSAYLRRVEAILSDRRDQIRKLSRIALAGTLAGVVLSLGLATALPVGEKGAKPNAAGAPNEAAKALTFGPVIERVVGADMGSGHGGFLIDLDTGKLFTPPEDLAPDIGGGFFSPLDVAAAFTWMGEQGIDAMGAHEPRFKGLIGVGLRAAPCADHLWDSATPQQAEAVWSERAGGLPVKILMNATEGVPKTFVIKTREGGIGILQIVGFTEEPKGVKIRYKMVQGATSAPTEEPAPGPLGGKQARFEGGGIRGEGAGGFAGGQKDSDRAVGGPMIKVDMRLIQVTAEGQKTVGAPRIMVADGQTSYLAVTTSKDYVSGLPTPDTAEPQVGQADTGLWIEVTPRVQQAQPDKIAVTIAVKQREIGGHIEGAGPEDVPVVAGREWQFTVLLQDGVPKTIEIVPNDPAGPRYRLVVSAEAIPGEAPIGRRGGD
jgi:beta-lactamase regulating signal transducer with metallopeptidase domain